MGATAVVAVAACVGDEPDVTGNPPREEAGAPNDGPGEDASEGGRRDPVGPCDFGAPFGPPVALSELNTPQANEDGAALTDSELEIFFMASSERHDGGTDDWNLYTAARGTAFDLFTRPRTVGVLTKPAHVESHPTLTADGTLIVYQSGDIDGHQGLALASRENAVGGFGTPIELDNLAAAGSAETTPFLSPDGARLYYGSQRDPSGSFDLYVAKREGSGFGAAELVKGTDLNTAKNERSPVLSRDELTLYFNSDRELPGGGHFDLRVWVAHRTSIEAPFDPPAPLAEVNAAPSAKISTRPTWLSADGCRLYIASNRDGKFDLYLVQKPARH